MCDKNFESADRLHTHRRSFHLKACCDKCDEAFPTDEALAAHECELESDEDVEPPKKPPKPYVRKEKPEYFCFTCPKRPVFDSFESKVHHTKTVHPDREHICCFCGHGFKAAEYLAHHQMEVHVRQIR